MKPAATAVVNSETDVCFLYETNKEGSKEPPVYFNVESDGETEESLNSKANGNVENTPMVCISNTVKTEDPDDLFDDSDDFAIFQSICKESEIKGEQLAIEGSDAESNADSNAGNDNEVTMEDGGVSDDNADESLGFKFPYEYLRQYCIECKKLITRQKTMTLAKCLTCSTQLLYECIVCRRRYKSSTNVLSHLKTKYDCRNLPDLHCSFCDYTSIHRGFMKNHILRKHGGGVDDLHSCTKCGRHFKQRHNAKEHELSCGTKPYFQCVFCDFRTSYKVSFKVHKAVHILEPEKGAALVNEKFEEVCVDPLSEDPCVWTPGASKEAIEEIKKNSNSKEKKAAGPAKVKIIDLFCRNMIKMYCYKCKETMVVKTKKPENCIKCQTGLLHQCGLCNSKFTTYPNMLRHFRDRHADDDIPHTYVCGICDKIYPGFQKLTRHETFCSRTLRCGLCPFTAKVPNVLRKHTQKWHFGPKKNHHNPCPNCGRQRRVKKDSIYCTNCT